MGSRPRLPFLFVVITSGVQSARDLQFKWRGAVARVLTFLMKPHSPSSASFRFVENRVGQPTSAAVSVCCHHERTSVREGSAVQVARAPSPASSRS